MNKKVIVLSPRETFSVRGLVVKLQGIGAEASYSGMKIKELKDVITGTDLIVYYMDDTEDAQAEALVFLKDHCIEHSIPIILIGERAEYDQARSYLPEECIRAFFGRPLEMVKLLDEVESFFEEKTEHEKMKSILVVDDDVAYLNTIFKWLKGSYRISMVNSGMQAITWLAKNHADLILLDYEMPVTSGPQVLEMIRSEVQTESIPVMFLTGKDDRASIMKVLSLKPQDYLLKTIDKEGLCKKLKEFFYRQQNS